MDRTDKVKTFRELRNKLKTIRTYKRNKPFKHLKIPRDFLNEVRRYERESEARKSAAEIASLLWFLERLIREARIFDNGSFLLQDPTIERFKAVLHMGWGMDCFSDTGFDYSRFTKVIETSADPKYKLLALEPIGVIYTAAQQRLRSFLIGVNIPPFPSPGILSSFFNNFSEPEMHMISHGYGRGIYFKVFSLRSALKEALNCPNLFKSFYAAKGVAFAYTMVNSRQLDRVFLMARELNRHNEDREECRYFSEGIGSALSFLEWNSPGLLESLEENTIIESSKEMVKTYQAEGGIFKL